MNFKLIMFSVLAILTIPNICFASDIGLCRATEKGKSETVKALIDVGGNVNCRCDEKRRMTPLMYSVWSRSVKSIQYLLEAGANPNLQDSYGYTALHFAAAQDTLEIVENLLQYGADPTMKTKKGHTAIDRAGDAGRAENVRLIGSYLNKPKTKSRQGLKPNTSNTDTLILKNGDILSGAIRTIEFSVESSYATLKFDFKKIDSVVYEGGTQNIEAIVLKNGDKISGRVGPNNIRIRLQSGQEIDVDKDKVKQINAKK